MANPEGKATAAASGRILDLPDIIITEIFLKLPFISLLRCKRVCKSWRAVVDAPYFKRLREQIDRTSPVILARLGPKLHFVEGVNVDLAAESTAVKGSGPSSLHLINSCDGLICATTCRKDRFECSTMSSDSLCQHHGRTIYIINPVTGEYAALPPCPEDRHMGLFGLGFCPKAKQHKVFRVVTRWSFNLSTPEYLRLWHSDQEYRQRRYLDFVVQIYNIGGGAWRRSEAAERSLRIHTILFDGDCKSFAYVNGFLYWIIHYNSVASFDFESETFRHPIYWEPNHYSVTRLGILGNHFCVYRFNYYQRLGNEVVVLKNVKVLGAGEVADREIVAKVPGEFYLVKYRENGDFYFLKNRHLFLKMGDLRRFVCSLRSEEDAIVHLPSFVSLKDVLRGDGTLRVLHVNR